MGDPTFNLILERIHAVIGTLVRAYNIKDAYINKYDPCSVILAAAAFVIFSTKNRLTGYSLGQLLFGHDIILPIKHMAGWELIHTQINKYNIH